MERFFTTTGPCDARRRYMLPAEARLPELARLVRRDLNFARHAPRQTGKTTAMRSFAATLRARGVAALPATLETSQRGAQWREVEGGPERRNVVSRQLQTKREGEDQQQP